MSGVRRTTAHRLTQAWNTVPHVFQHDRADITGVETLRKRLSKKVGSRGQSADHHHRVPDEDAGRGAEEVPADELIGRSRDRRDHLQAVRAHRRGGRYRSRPARARSFATSIRRTSFRSPTRSRRPPKRRRNRKLSLDDMQGGSITISNLGSLGGGAFTPIVNWPEVAILGVARARMEPVYSDGEFVRAVPDAADAVLRSPRDRRRRRRAHTALDRRSDRTAGVDVA